MLTAGTYHKEKLFHDKSRLDLLESTLLETLEDLGWRVPAWAVFPNHYHFVGISPDQGLGLTELTKTIRKPFIAIQAESLTSSTAHSGEPSGIDVGIQN